MLQIETKMVRREERGSGNREPERTDPLGSPNPTESRKKVRHNESLTVTASVGRRR